MKKYIFTLATLFIAFFAQAQLESPAKWTYTAKKISANTYELHITATIQPKWHVYSQDIKGDGPVPTSFSFDKNALIKYEGKVQEVGKSTKEYSKVFAMTLSYYANKVDFVQKVTLKSPINTIAKGKFTYMVCNDEKCLAPTTIPFSIKINGKS
jgi:Disulphide bond corrector protein DsbC